MASEFEKEGAEEGFEPYEPYSPLRKHGWMDKTLLTYIGIGIGILVLVVLIISLRSGSGDGPTAQKVADLERRLDDLEFRIAEAEALRGRLDLLESNGQDVGEVGRRVAQFEESVVDHLNQLDRKLATLEKNKANAAAKPSTPASGSEKTVKKAAASKPAPKTRTHVVQSGETLYSIGRKYDASIDAIRKLNRIDADFTIHPGQKIQVPN